MRSQCPAQCKRLVTFGRPSRHEAFAATSPFDGCKMNPPHIPHQVKTYHDDNYCIGVTVSIVKIVVIVR